MEKYPILGRIDHPVKLKNLSFEELEQLAKEIRSYIIETVSLNGGHLAPNLGVVELTISLLRIYNSPYNKVVWDVGHQCYTYKLLTGRAKEFASIRKQGGLSGFPKREESSYDHFDTGHASTSVSASIGLLTAERFLGHNEKVFCVIGDGALTGGQAFEALNYAGHREKNLVVILNDNKMSISKNVGALSAYLSRMTSTNKYISFRIFFEKVISFLPVLGPFFLKTFNRIKRGVKGVFYRENLFTDLGFKYIGPIDGHDISKLSKVLENVRSIEQPVVIHVLTKKGKGYAHAEGNPSAFHGVGPFKIETGKVDPALSRLSLKITTTKAFGSALVKQMDKDSTIVGVTAAMGSGTGLSMAYEAYPKRVFDVGIAEPHGLTFAAGMAAGGLKPVVAIYSTFMQRGVDQVIHDIAIPCLPVVICMDRSGLVGGDGETHQGVFDINIFRNIPNILFLAPISAFEIELSLKWALKQEKPVLIRYPKGEELDIAESQKSELIPGRGVMVRDNSSQKSVLLISLGGLLKEVTEAADALRHKGVDTDVHHMRFIRPLDIDYLSDLIGQYSICLFIEEGIEKGGLGEEIGMALKERNIKTNYRFKGIPLRFLSQATRSELITECCLDSRSIEKEIDNIMNKQRISRVVDMVKNDKWSPHNI